MRPVTVATIALSWSLVSAFKDTSPYILLSTSQLPTAWKPFSSRQLQTQEEVRHVTVSFLSQCPSETYVIISQPGLEAADLSTSTSMPHLQQALSSKHTKTRCTIAEVSGLLEPKELGKAIAAKCNALETTLDLSEVISHTLKSESQPLVVYVNLPALPSKTNGRASQLAHNDYLLQSVLSHLPSQYSLMYTSTPASEVAVDDGLSYEPAFTDVLHGEIKRRSTVEVSKSNRTDDRSLPLFEMYQFLSPGIFMVLVVSIVLLSILGVGLSAISSLKVSYGAFDKEMGPAAQKKQQ